MLKEDSGKRKLNLGVLKAQEVLVSFEYTAATSGSSNDAVLRGFINGVEKDSVTNGDQSKTVDKVRFGGVAGGLTKTAASSVYLDEWASFN